MTMTPTERVLSFDVGLRHLAYAILTVEEQTGPDCAKKICLERWGVVDVMERMEEGNKSRDALTTAIVETLDREFYDGAENPHYDHVLIENQPARKNPEMKGVQMSIHTYFATMRLYVGCVGEIHLVSAKRKLQGEDATKKASYRERKALSVELGKKALTEMGGDIAEAALVQLARTKKKDDLCDALLQGLEWLAPPPPKPPRSKRVGKKVSAVADAPPAAVAVVAAAEAEAEAHLT